MKKFRSKINNSYESSDSSGSASSAEQRRRSSEYDAMEKGLGHNVNNLLLPDYEAYNISGEEALLGATYEHNSMPAPSYEPDYDYFNEYSTTPLVYSWLPIVPGFNQDGTDNLQNFEHIMKRLNPKPLNFLNTSQESTTKHNDSMSTLNSSSAYTFQRLELLDSTKDITATSFSHPLDEDSCNAMDLNISCHQQTAAEEAVNIDLSFNGKISEMTSSGDKDESQFELLPVEEKDIRDESFELLKKDETPPKSPEESHMEVAELTIEDEEEKIRNESFELLKKEDSSRMHLVNEKSPEVSVKTDDCSENEEQPIVEPEVSKKDTSTDASGNISVESGMGEDVTYKTLDEADSFIKNNIQSSLSELCAPPSINTLPLSLSEMLAIYKQNLEKEKTSTVKSNQLFVPSHPLSEVMSMEWPDLQKVNAHGIMYNRSNNCEEIEHMRVRYIDKFIRSETTSSYTHKNGPTSAKKRVEKLKFLTASPSSRLSHLANRRKIFSSANLKNTSATASQKSSGSSFLIDKSKLYHKKKTSAKKKTPGKKKTPKSAKRQQQLQLPKPQPTVASSKRALFTSPAKSSKPTAGTSKEIPTQRGVLPRRNLFSPTQNSKRRRSPSPDAENRFGKCRRLESPSKHPNQLLTKSRSFSIAATSTSTGSLDEHYKKTLYYRTQSEYGLNQSMDSKSNVGLKRPLTEEETKKLLWSASSALQTKQISREHEKFKPYMQMLCKLVKKLLQKFYQSNKSMSHQMQRFSTLVVFHVIQEKSFDEIFTMAKSRLESQNQTKISGYIAPDVYEKNHFVRKNSSLLLMPTLSCSSLNSSTGNSDSLLEGSLLDRCSSDTSLNRSTSKSNAEGNVLRENVQNSGRKAFASDSNLSKLSNTSTPSSNILKAKRQISF